MNKKIYMNWGKGFFIGILMVCAVFFVTSSTIVSDTHISVDDITISDDLTVGDDVTISGTLTKPQDTAIKMYSNTSDVVGEPMPLEFYGVVPEAKPFLEWRNWYFDNNQSTMVYGYSAWMGAHYNSSLNSDRHQHFAIETLDLNTSTLNTRFAIDYGRFLENMTAYFNAINYLQLRSGVDLRIRDGDIEHENELDFYTENQKTLGLRTELYDVEGNVSISAVGSSFIVINDEVKTAGTRTDGAGKAVCIKSDETFGTCSDAVGAGGTCTCV